MPDQLVIKKSPVVIIQNLILLEMVATILYFGAAVVGNYGEIYHNFNFPQILSYELAKMLFKIVVEVAIVGVIFLRWYFETYTFHRTMLVIEKGIFWKQRKTYSLGDSFSLSFHFSPLSWLLRYGTLMVKFPGKEELVSLPYVPNPELYLKVIKDYTGGKAVPDLEKQVDVQALLSNREHEGLEFKTSLRWDMKEGKVNRALEKSVMKSIAAFLNSDGGHLVIGVADNGAVIGLENDYGTLRRPDADGFENHFTNVFKDVIGPEFRRFVKLTFGTVHTKEVCVIGVLPAVKPAYLKFDNEESFYIRTGNSTTPLHVREAAAYIQSRWGNTSLS